MTSDDFSPLERYLRDLPLDTQEVTISFVQIERIMNGELPTSAHQDQSWWGNQKQGTQVESIPWMDAGWMVDTVDLLEKLVKFVRQ
jgi:hypothetical protein